MRRLRPLRLFGGCLLAILAACSSPPSPASSERAAGHVTLSSADIENIVRRSFQYVAMYNVINKGALDPSAGLLGTNGWNKLKLNTQLADADIKAIARPNNDSLYQIALLDLRHEPMVLDVPAIDSGYVSLETSSYDHYCDIPMSTRLGDYKKRQKVLFFTARTRGYTRGDRVDGIDRYLEMTGDFVIAFHRVMPHASDPVRYKRIVGQIESMKLMTRSEHQGTPATRPPDTTFPGFGKTDADIFGGNLLEVMQFVFNHTTFDPNDPLDQALLAAYKPLGVEPGKAWNPAMAPRLDAAAFRQVSEQVHKQNLAMARDPKEAASLLMRVFRPKGRMDLEALVFQSAFGPIGVPADEAVYPPITTEDGAPMNAMNDYVITMPKAALPPARAFWSITLYDTKNGFFIPNPGKKYSVGENAGYRLNANGGIEVHVAARKPAGVPAENWLPINRTNEDIDIVMRIYVPDLERMKTWKAPVAARVR